MHKFVGENFTVMSCVAQLFLAIDQSRSYSCKTDVLLCGSEPEDLLGSIVRDIAILLIYCTRLFVIL